MANLNPNHKNRQSKKVYFSISVYSQPPLLLLRIITKKVYFEIGIEK